MHGHGHGHGVSHDAGTDDGAPFLTRDKLVLLLGLITYGIGQSVLFIVFPPLVDDIGLSLTQFGLIFSVSNLVLAMAAIYWGRMSDKVGRKPMLMLGLFGYALGTTIMALSLEWGLRSAPAPWLLFSVIVFARLIYAGLASAISPSATAYIADTTTRSQRGRGMALIGLTSGLGTLLGPVIGGAFAFVSVIFPLYVAVGLAVLALIMIAFTLTEPEKQPAPTHDLPRLAWWDPRVRGFLIMMFCFWMFFTMIQIIIAFYIEQDLGLTSSTEVAQATASALFSMAIAAVLMQAVVMQKFRLSTRTMLRLGCPAFAAGMGLLLIGGSLVMVWIAFFLFGIALALANAGIAGGASLSVEPHEQGAVGGLLSAAPILGMVLGPLLGPALFEMGSPSLPIMAGLGALLLLSAYALTIKVDE